MNDIIEIDGVKYVRVDDIPKFDDKIYFFLDYHTYRIQNQMPLELQFAHDLIINKYPNANVVTRAHVDYDSRVENVDLTIEDSELNRQIKDFIFNEA